MQERGYFFPLHSLIKIIWISISALAADEARSNDTSGLKVIRVVHGDCDTRKFLNRGPVNECLVDPSLLERVEFPFLSGQAHWLIG